MLTKEELQRYSRQLDISRWGPASQERLKSSTVFIAGAGGLGSPVSIYLAAAGTGRIIICDSDHVEISNLNRQVLYSTGDIGKSKADAAAAALSLLNPHVEIIPVHDEITEHNASGLIEGSDIIVDCLDSFRVRRFINSVSVNNSIPLVHGGISGFNGQASFLAPPDTACLACFLSDRKGSEPEPVAGAAAGLIGSIQAVEALRYLTGLGSSLKGRLLFWDGAAMEFETIMLKKNPSCSVCGKS